MRKPKVRLKKTFSKEKKQLSHTIAGWENLTEEQKLLEVIAASHNRIKHLYREREKLLKEESVSVKSINIGHPYY